MGKRTVLLGRANSGSERIALPQATTEKDVIGALSAHGGLFVFVFLPALLLRVTVTSPFSHSTPGTDLSLFQGGRGTAWFLCPQSLQCQAG